MIFSGLLPLGYQKVDPNDSVFHGMVGPKGTGLNTSYQSMIQKAFLPQYWQSSQPVPIGAAPPGGTAPMGTQMEANFALFFGLATQTYESTLVSSSSPFDKFMQGNDNALTAEQLQGLLIYINTGQGGLPASAAQGNCVACHAGPEFTAAGATTMNKTGFISIVQMPVAGGGRIGSPGTATAYVDNGFANIGVRPTAEDPARGGSVAVGTNKVPMSWVRQALAGTAGAPALPPCGGSGQPVCPVNNRDAVQGAFKIPSLRNIELTGPYFHNGGQATLKQAVDFYDSFDFSSQNIDNLDPRMLNVHIGKGDATTLTSFLQSLTDPNVRNESAAFDHPQLFLPNGPGADNTVACLTNGSCAGLITLPAAGSPANRPQGRAGAGLGAEPTFLNLDPHQG